MIEETLIRKQVNHFYISSLGETLREKDYNTKTHANRVRDLALILGEALNLGQNNLDRIILLSNFHDIGKIAIPNSILLKPGPLSAKEWHIIQKHSEIGYQIAKTSSLLHPIAEGILSHHEWWNGAGYPQGLKKQQIPLIARLITIVDAYDAMTHDRPYKKAMSPAEAKDELRKCAGSQFDPELVNIFIHNLK